MILNKVQNLNDDVKNETPKQEEGGNEDLAEETKSTKKKCNLYYLSIKFSYCKKKSF
jgi:hypothetical protein